MLFGVDYLAGLKYQKVMLQTHRPGWSAAIFLRTFGDARKTVRAMAESGKFSEIVVHLAPFDNNHAYPIQELMSQLKKDASWLEGIALAFPNCKLLLSPFCEHNHSKKDMLPLFIELREIAPHCLMLNSIWKGERIEGIITEIHLTTSKLPPKPKGEYTISFDGFGGDGSGNFTDTNIEKIINTYSDARHIRLWNFRYNGKANWKDKTPIPDRKTWPDKAYMLGHNAMMKKREGPISWPENGLFKPFAEDRGGGGKDNHAMCILPKEGNTVSVRDSKGIEIDIMRRVDPPSTTTPKGARFYSNLHAYELGDKAQKNTGSRRIKIDKMPLTDGDLRSNHFK